MSLKIEEMTEEEVKAGREARAEKKKEALMKSVIEPKLQKFPAQFIVLKAYCQDESCGKEVRYTGKGFRYKDGKSYGHHLCQGCGVEYYHEGRFPREGYEIDNEKGQPYDPKDIED